MDDFDNDFENQVYYAEVQKWEADRQSVKHGHDKLDHTLLNGRLEAIYLVRQPVHVGSGMLVPPEKLGLTSDQKLVKAFFRFEKFHRIPGTSLKGAFRSLVEMYTDSCAPATKDGNACRYKNEKSTLCPACLIFGAMGYQGAITFEDGLFFKEGRKNAIRNIPPQFGPKAHPGMRRYYPHKLVDQRSPTWPVEVLLPGAKFLVKASFKNLSEAQLGLVLIAMGLGEWQLCPKIGAGKSAGLGAIQIQQSLIELFDPVKSFTQLEPQTEQVPPDKYIESAKGHLNMDILNQLAEDLSSEQLGEVEG